MLNHQKPARAITMAGSGFVLAICLIGTGAFAQQNQSNPWPNRWANASSPRQITASPKAGTSKSPGPRTPSVPSPSVALHNSQMTGSQPHSTLRPPDVKPQNATRTSSGEELDQLERASLQVKTVAPRGSSPKPQPETHSAPIDFSYHDMSTDKGPEYKH
jgi:hypothetical protein